MSLDSHSFGDGADHEMACTSPQTSPRQTTVRAHWSLTPSGCPPDVVPRDPILLRNLVGHTLRRVTLPSFPHHTCEIPSITVGSPKPCRPHRFPTGAASFGRPETWRLEQGLLSWCHTITANDQGGHSSARQS